MRRRLEGAPVAAANALEHFQQKWEPVLRPELRQKR
jgi:hypothetical protein